MSSDARPGADDGAPGTPRPQDTATDTASDAVRRLDDPDFPALTMSQAAALLGVQAAFLRSLDGSGVLHPHRSPGGHRRYSRHQLVLAARLRGLLDEGHPLASAEVIVGLQDELADARASNDRLRDTVDRLRSDSPESPTPDGDLHTPGG
ncbi:MerR family transcriptional regulator [Geodermatophilus sp. SYSU D00814]